MKIIDFLTDIFLDCGGVGVGRRDSECHVEVKNGQRWCRRPLLKKCPARKTFFWEVNQPQLSHSQPPSLLYPLTLALGCWLSLSFQAELQPFSLPDLTLGWTLHPALSSPNCLILLSSMAPWRPLMGRKWEKRKLLQALHILSYPGEYIWAFSLGP